MLPAKLAGELASLQYSTWASCAWQAGQLVATTHRVSEPGHHVHRLPGEPLLVAEHGEHLQAEQQEERHGRPAPAGTCAALPEGHYTTREDDLHLTVV